MTAYVARLVERDEDDQEIETIDLTGGPVALNGWVPAAGESTLSEFVDATRDGGETVENTLRNVVESIPVTVLDEVVDEVNIPAQDTIDAINAMLARGTAYAKARRMDRRVFLEAQRTDSSPLWRSPVVAFRPAQLTGDSFGLDAAAGGAQALITLTRRYYVEGEEVEVPLSEDTGGVTIYNHNDGDSGHVNYVDIAAADVVGALPSPIKLSVGFNVHDHQTLYVGESLIDPAGESHVLEGEDNTQYSGTTADVTCSGGAYCDIVFSSGGMHLLLWTLDADFLSYARGRWFRLIGRFQAAPDIQEPLTVTRYITKAGDLSAISKYFGSVSTVLGYSGHTLLDFGGVQIPPWLIGSEKLVGDSSVGLEFYKAYEDLEESVKLDFVQMLPLDGYALYQNGYRSGANLVDDGGMCYFEDGDGLRSGGVQRFGNGVWLWPGQMARLFFLGEDSDYGSDIAQTFTVQAWYRPRRASF